MLSPLIPDIRHPKWVIVVKLLEIIASPRANKIAGRLKIYDKDKFLLSIKVLIVNGKIKFPNYGSENSSDLLKTFAFCFFDWIDSEELG